MIAITFTAAWTTTFSKAAMAMIISMAAVGKISPITTG
jgi:hypothetical protein